MVVSDTFGNCRIGSFHADCRPSSRMSRLTTVASTGRLTKMSVKPMAWHLLHRLVLRFDEGHRIVDPDLGARLDFVLAGGHDLIAGLDPFSDPHPPVADLSRLHEASFDLILLLLDIRIRLLGWNDHVDAVSVETVGDSRLRHR